MLVLDLRRANPRDADLPPGYTVIKLATGEDHGTYDSEAEVSMCLAFARLPRVEVIADEPVLASIVARE